MSVVHRTSPCVLLVVGYVRCTPLRERWLDRAPCLSGVARPARRPFRAGSRSQTSATSLRYPEDPACSDWADAARGVGLSIYGSLSMGIRRARRGSYAGKRARGGRSRMASCGGATRTPQHSSATRERSPLAARRASRRSSEQRHLLGLRPGRRMAISRWWLSGHQEMGFRNGLSHYSRRPAYFLPN